MEGWALAGKITPLRSLFTLSLVIALKSLGAMALVGTLYLLTAALPALFADFTLRVVMALGYPALETFTDHVAGTVGIIFTFHRDALTLYASGIRTTLSILAAARIFAAVGQADKILRTVQVIQALSLSTLALIANIILRGKILPALAVISATLRLAATALANIAWSTVTVIQAFGWYTFIINTNFANNLTRFTAIAVTLTTVALGKTKTAIDLAKITIGAIAVLFASRRGITNIFY